MQLDYLLIDACRDNQAEVAKVFLNLHVIFSKKVWITILSINRINQSLRWL